MLAEQGPPGNDASRVHAQPLRFSVVVVNYNGGAMLARCMASILAQAVAEQDIILVDNGSQDRSLDDAQGIAPRAQLIRNDCNAGFARAVNQGLALAEGDLVLLLNNDAELRDGALDAFRDAFAKHPNMVIAGGQLRYPDGRQQNAVALAPTLATECLPKFLTRWLAPGRFSGRPQASQPVPVPTIIGACLALRRAALAALGGLDEDYFFFLEETEWCERAHAHGYEVYYVPGAVAVHAQGQTAKRFHAGARIEFHRSKLTFFRKTRPQWSYYLVSLVLPIRAVINALANTLACLFTLCLLSHQRRRAGGYWKIALWHLGGRPAHWGLPDKCPRKAKAAHS